MGKISKTKKKADYWIAHFANEKLSRRKIILWRMEKLNEHIVEMKFFEIISKYVKVIGVSLMGWFELRRSKKNTANVEASRS